MEVILKVWFQNTCYQLSWRALRVKLLSCECHWTPLMINQHWIMKWLITWRHLNRSWASSMSPYDVTRHNELAQNIPRACIGHNKNFQLIGRSKAICRLARFVVFFCGKVEPNSFSLWLVYWQLSRRHDIQRIKALQWRISLECHGASNHWQLDCFFNSLFRIRKLRITGFCRGNLPTHDVIKWKHFSRYWLFVRGNHRSPVNSPHKGQWRGTLMFSLICARINCWVNNREAGDLRRYRAHYDVIVMYQWPVVPFTRVSNADDVSTA